MVSGESRARRGNLIKLHALMTYGEVEVCMHAFLAAGVDG